MHDFFIVVYFTFTACKKIKLHLRVDYLAAKSHNNERNTSFDFRTVKYAILLYAFLCLLNLQHFDGAPHAYVERRADDTQVLDLAI